MFKKPFISNFAEALKNTGTNLSLGTQTLTDAKEQPDEDDKFHYSLGTETFTKATGEAPDNDDDYGGKYLL